MTRTTLTLLCITLALWANAQNANVVNAYNYMQDGDYAKAAEYIDQAATNESTMAKDKTWRYRGDIYRLIAMGTDEALKAQYPDAMQKAIDSYLKAKELDTKGNYKNEIVQNLGALQGASLNKGNDAFGAKDYDKAIQLYGNSMRIAEAFGQVDTNAIFNSALAYETKGDAPKAIELYSNCLDMGYDKPEVYRYLASLQKKQGDLDGAIATTERGKAKYPTNKDLILDELNFQLEAGRDAEAEKSVKEAITADPDNAVLYSVLGSLYDAKATPKEGQTLSEEDIATWSGKAEEAYKTSIEKDPDFFDAYFNIGVLYNNRAASCYEKANAIKDNDKYNKAKTACDEIYLKAVPYFEKAHELNPDDAPTVQQLMKLYAKTGDLDKAAEMKKLLGN
ncbi:MAG: tetratricopeptide repeat protein [Flavobacteriales bacterium]|nr:tetratricopeptide repeat protein [Flavobacteriales bacterium]MCB9193875.1 tetratricopeptide repeat protein [Flavobacteriales bacterium]